ncbi:hypothetical protein NRY66_03710 [Acidithiobacillus ferrooxidans]|nr:hypothetical protein [Acidithiobacillus ferrooxidans]
MPCELSSNIITCGWLAGRILMVLLAWAKLLQLASGAAVMDRQSTLTMNF